jgi:hypothetical protein
MREHAALEKLIVIVLLLEHGIGTDRECIDGECIDAEYIATNLQNDWGFYYTVTTNLDKT